ncbi:hypothetical protein CH373_00100 [Leptospira perolatii]|uniref:Porin n=1 Tax=Leptospira perolatii TaxID=2023191 RepID=A0A2M9ZRB3_9LEPT|nr:porin [Leptospira perolatii]PJZ70979.1 hypothetical protein CH360_00100 [Leptospira perolatii]PJZ74511.1 hypothetical protein CH373_00100 [Leptospira perolatii]
MKLLIRTVALTSLILSSSLFGQTKDIPRPNQNSESEKELLSSQDKEKKSIEPIENPNQKEKGKLLSGPYEAKFGFFIDTYYNNNLNRPRNTRERDFTTQAVRNNEFNINLAHLEGTITSERFRGRVAIQFGTSVNANYAAESTTEKTSNQFSVRNMQETYGGLKFGKSTWVDAGIYLSHIGYESWISHDNFVYTRSLSLDYVPYYISGVRLHHDLGQKFSFELHVINGWQIVTDNNRDVSGGFRIEWKPTNTFFLRWNTFMGNENPSQVAKEMRYYNNFVTEWKPSDSLTLAASFDVGYQERAYEKDLIYLPSGPTYIQKDSNAFRQWYSGNLWIGYRFLQDWRIGTRIERFVDREQVVASTGTRDGFQTGGGTVTLDYNPDPAILARLTYQYRRSMDPIFAYSSGHSREERLLIFSLSLKI